MSTLTVIETPTHSFVKIDTKYRKYLVNGEEPVQCLGNDQWSFIQGKISSVELVERLSPSRTGWKLRENYHYLPEDKFPRWVSKERFEWDDEEPEYNFYEAEYSEAGEQKREQEFSKIIASGPPQVLPGYVKVHFPNDLLIFPELQYLFPCSIGYESVFQLLWNRVQEYVKNSQGLLKAEGYHNIQTLKVNRKVLIPESLQKTVYEDQTQWGKKKPKRVKVTHTEKWVQIWSCVGKYEAREGDEQVAAVEGKDYEDLQANLEKYLETFTSRLKVESVTICECCKGKGVLIGGTHP